MKKPVLKLQYNAPVTLSFALLSLGVLLLSGVTGGLSTRLLFSVYRSPLTDLFTYPRFFLHVLGHADYSHYISNMLLLLVVGPMIEEKYGSLRLLGFMAITAFATGMVQFLLFPGSALLGASGIVFMLIMLSSLAGMRDGAVPLTLILVTILYLGGELLAGLSQSDNISQLTHIVGGVSGTLLGFIAAPGHKKRS